MTFRKFVPITLAACLSFGFAMAPTAHAQSSDGQAASASVAPSSKATQKAQRKAERKANRAKKNAELSELKKQGYNPNSNQTTYPQNIQNAEKKAQGQGEKPASAP